MSPISRPASLLASALVFGPPAPGSLGSSQPKRLAPKWRQPVRDLAPARAERTTIACYLVFVRVLSIPLPAGFPGF